MNHRALFLSSAILLTACGAPATQDESVAGDQQADDGGATRVFTLSNEAAGNRVLVFTADKSGALQQSSDVATGGLGNDGGLGSQGAIVTSRDGRWLLAVNAGSDEVSLFRVHDDSIDLADIAPSGGNMPISVTESNGIAYVLNAGATQNISGYRIHDGHLQALSNSTRALSADTGVGAAQVQFSRDGDALVVTEKGTNSIDTFVVHNDGRTGSAIVTPSTGTTPFGFAFARYGTLVVSDAYGGAAGAGALSSYTIGHHGAVSLVTGPVADAQTAPCWVVSAKDGSVAYTTNAGSDNVSGYSVALSGALTLFADGGATATLAPGAHPTDMATSKDGKLLFVLEGGTHSVASLKIGKDGHLTAAGEIAGLPAHAVGLAAR